MAADLIRLLGDLWIDDLDLDRMEQLPTEYVSNDLRNPPRRPALVGTILGTAPDTRE